MTKLGLIPILWTIYVASHLWHGHARETKPLLVPDPPGCSWTIVPGSRLSHGWIQQREICWDHTTGATRFYRVKDGQVKGQTSRHE